MIRKLPVKVIVPELDTLPINVLLVVNDSATRSHPKSNFNLPAEPSVSLRTWRASSFPSLPTSEGPKRGQAQRSVRWKRSIPHLMRHLQLREGSCIRAMGVSRFERGDVPKLRELEKQGAPR